MDWGFRDALPSTVVKNEFVVEISNKIVLIFCQRTALSMPSFVEMVSNSNIHNTLCFVFEKRHFLTS